MSSLMEAIRRATGGAGKPRLDDKKPDDMEDEDKTSAEDETDDPDAEDDEDKPAAEDGKDDPDAEEDEDETEAEDEEEERTAKKLSAPERSAFAKGRKAERRRLSKILGSKAASANPTLAAHLAFATSDPASKALASLKAAGPAASNGGIAARMNNRPPSRTGRGGENATRSKDAASAWSGPLAKAGVKLKGK